MIDYKQKLQELKSLKKEDLMFTCSKCGSIKHSETFIKERQEKFVIKGEEIIVKGCTRYCNKCHCKVSDVTLDDEMLIEAYNKYKKIKGLLLPKEIEKIRQNYKLSAKKFAALLNLGTHTIYRYEKGSIQDSSHDALIKSISNFDCLYTYLLNNKTQLKEFDVKSLLKMCEEKREVFIELSQKVARMSCIVPWKLGVC